VWRLSLDGAVRSAGVSVTAATALLRQLQASYGVSLGEARYFDLHAGVELWLLTATSNDGEVWIVQSDDYYLGACGLAEMMGFELTDG
jgi:hypothetical protein